MKGILREQWNSESGSAQIIEMTLIFPIVLFVLGFLIYVGSYVLQSTAMYLSLIHIYGNSWKSFL